MTRRALRTTIPLLIVAAGCLSFASQASAGTTCGTNGVLTSAGNVSTCTYTKPGEDTFNAPLFVTTIHVVAVGQTGGIGAAYENTQGTGNGGAGAKVDAELPLTLSTLFVEIPANPQPLSMSGCLADGGWVTLCGGAGGAKAAAPVGIPGCADTWEGAGGGSGFWGGGGGGGAAGCSGGGGGGGSSYAEASASSVSMTPDAGATPTVSISWVHPVNREYQYLTGGATGLSIKLWHVNVPGFPEVRGATVIAGSQTTCSGSTGATYIGYLAVGTDVLIAHPKLVAANTHLTVGDITVDLNDQTLFSFLGDQGLTVDAIKVTFGAPSANVAYLTVGAVESDIGDCPGQMS
jgi:hypothetical protein